MTQSTSTKRKIGCLFGSFDPIHNGHLIVGEFMATMTNLDEVMFVVSPQSPHKIGSLVVPFAQRVEMAQLACANNALLSVSEIEASLPTPSYTIDALDELSNRHDDCEYTLLIGSDNLERFQTWKAWEAICDQYGIYVYPRPDYPVDPEWFNHNIKVFDAPLLNISSTYIRHQITAGQSVRYLVPQIVMDFIKSNALYARIAGN